MGSKHAFPSRVGYAVQSYPLKPQQFIQSDGSPLFLFECMFPGVYYKVLLISGARTGPNVISSSMHVHVVNWVDGL